MDMVEIFEACPDCHAEGGGNALFFDGVVVDCPKHGEITDSQRMAEYRQHASQFLAGKVPTQKQPVLSSEVNT